MLILIGSHLFPQKSDSPFSQKILKYSRKFNFWLFTSLKLSKCFLWSKLSSKGRRMHRKVCKVLRATCRNIQLAVLPDSDLVSRAISELPPVVFHDSPLGPPLKDFLFCFFLDVFPCNPWQVLGVPRKCAQEFRITILYVLTSHLQGYSR